MDVEGKRLLNIIRSNARGMSQLIDGLLAFSRLGHQPLDQADVNMEDLARSTFDEIQAVNKDRPVKMELQALPPAFGDRAMIRQVFYNLLSNAFKFTRPKPNPTVEIGFQEGGNQNILRSRQRRRLRHAIQFQTFRRLSAPA